MLCRCSRDGLEPDNTWASSNGAGNCLGATP